MKKALIPVIAFFCMSLSAYAEDSSQPRCGGPTPVQQFKKGDDFGFVTSITCLVSGDSSGHVTNIKEYYRKFISTSNAFSWNGKYEAALLQAMTGYKLKATEYLTVTYGRIELPSEILLLDDSAEKFAYAAIVEKAKGSGDTSHMVARKVHVNAILTDATSNTYSVTTSVEAIVKKPRFAPSFVFRSAVISGMESDIKVRAREHAELIVKGLTFNEPPEA